MAPALGEVVRWPQHWGRGVGGPSIGGVGGPSIEGGR